MQDVLNSSFYKMPKFLFKDEFKKLSSDAKILYTLLNDRHTLSIDNGWINENNQVYLIYTREAMADMLGCSLPTVRKAIKQLIEFKLIEEERQGLNKPNLIFLCYAMVESTRTEKSFHSGQKETFTQDSKKLSGSKTNNNKTNSNKTDNLHILSEYVCDCEDPVKDYLRTYLDIRQQYRDKPHKKVSTRNISVIKEELINISDYVDIEEFTDRVHDYFQEINNNNDGDIIYFLKASRRYFILDEAVI